MINQRKNDLLHKYHALDSNEETFIDVQEQNDNGIFHFNRHRRFLEIVEKEFFGKNFVLFNQDDVQFQSNQDVEDIIDEGCEMENKIYSACSGYCSLVESEQIAYQNDEQKRKSLKIENNDKKMSCILQYNECKRKEENDKKVFT